MRCISSSVRWAWILGGCLIGQATSVAQDHSVASSAEAFQVRQGYQVELSAGEPLTVDPVAARFDPRGRLWVVEMPDYPTGPQDGDEPSGRIRVLQDHDSDGRFDEATTFAEQLPFATGVQPYGDGALVTLAGQVIHFHDRDRDGVAEDRTVLFKGFATGNEQLRANHPTLGPDGLVYVAGGLRGGKITAVDSRFDASQGPVDLRDRDFCFDPEGGRWTAVAGKSQFGLTIDDFGRRIGCSNRNPAMAAPLTLQAVQRDPLLAPRDAVADLALSAEQSGVVPISDAWTTSNLHAGQFSAACGVLAPGLWAEGHEWLLVCEPTGSLVQRQRLFRQDSIWASRREKGQHEFLASSDTWFRPVDLTVGPGGDVYVVDMARAVIEHPDWMPSELKDRPDMWHGNDLGRIWRIHRGSQQPPERGIADAADALRWLGAENPWQRQMASHYFLIRGIGDREDELRAVVRSPNASAACRARVAQLLDRFDRLDDGDCRSLLASADPRLRAVAVRLAVGRDELVPSLLELAGEPDSDPLVLRHLALVLGESGDQLARRADALAKIASRGGAGDPWVRRAVGSAAAELTDPLAQLLLQQPEPHVELCSRLVRRIAGRSPEAAATVLQSRLNGGAEQARLDGFSAALLQAWHQGVGSTGRSAAKIVPQLPEAPRRAIEAAHRRAVRTALNDAADGGTRAVCVQLAAGAGMVPNSFRELVSAASPPPVREAALGVLLEHDAPWMRDYLSDHLTEMTLQLRLRVVDSCLRSRDNTRWLLGRIDDGVLPKTLIDPATAGRLRKHSDEAIRALAGELFAASPNRLRVLKRYAAAAESLGEAQAGEKLFVEHCSACHKISGTGVNVGPDISDTRTKKPEELLRAILVPNAAIDADYMKHSVLTRDGRILDGLLVDETDQSLTLAQQGGDRMTISREEIEEFQTPGVSLMPEGFEQSISVAQMADLLAYLKNWRYLSSDIPIQLTR